MVQYPKCLVSLLFFFVVFHLHSANGSIPSGPGIESPTLTLNVRDSVLMAMEHNRALAVERYGPDVYQTFISEEKAIFDPALTSEISATETKGQRTSGVGEFRGVTSRYKDLSVGISKQTPSGIGIDLETTVNTRESNVYTRLYSTRLGATLTVPLMEGRGREVNLVGIQQAERDVDLSQYELQGFVLALIARVEENYWDLLAAREELRIRLYSLGLAKEQLKETQDRIEVGAIAEFELAAAEGEVALREEAVIDARSAFEKSTILLLQTLNPPVENFWSLAIDLLESPTQEEAHPGPVDQHIAIALQNRPDLNQARVQSEKKELDIVKTRNGLLPRLDFFITLGKTGYATSFTNTMQNFDEDNFDLNTGLIFQYSFGSRVERARYRRAKYLVRETQAALSNFEQLVELDVRTGYIELNRTTKQIAATHAATRLQEAKYLTELEKFRVGKSTNLLVLVSQRDLTQSRLDELRAQINMRKALVNFHYVKGTLLDHHRIVLPRSDVITAKGMSDSLQ